MPVAKVLVFSKKAADGSNLAKVLTTAKCQVVWTDNGPEAICQALSGELDAVIVFIRKKGHQELEYVPCINSIDQTLPVIVISDHDSLKLQRAVRQHKVFYYLPQPFEESEIKAVLQDALAAPGRK